VLAYRHTLSTAFYLYTCTLANTQVHIEHVGPFPYKGKFSESGVQVGMSPFVLHPQEGLFYQSLMYV
jgi:hypothetical protein